MSFLTTFSRIVSTTDSYKADKKTRHLAVAGFGVTEPAEAGWIIRRLPSSR